MKFAITIQVPPSKRVYWGDHQVYYSKLSPEDQKLVITSYLNGWEDYFEAIVFEKTKVNPRMHLHGVMVFENHDQYNMFVEHMMTLTTPKNGIGYVLCAKPLNEPKGWEKYMKKDQFDPMVMKKVDYPYELCLEESDGDYDSS